MLRKRLNRWPVVAWVKSPAALKHKDSFFCWCDPFVEVNEKGQETVVHKEVTWN